MSRAAGESPPCTLQESVARPGPGGTTLFYGHLIVGASFLLFVVTYGTYYSFGIFFKPLLVQFDWTRAMTSGAFSLATLLMGLLAIFMGRLNDRFGPRLVMTLCGLFLGPGYWLMSQISQMWQLYLFYGIMVGIGMGTPYVALVSAIARWFERGRGLMTGIAVAGISAGAAIVPPVASQMIASFDWRTSYAIMGGAILVLVVAAAQFLRRAPSQTGQAAAGAPQSAAAPPGTPVAGYSVREAARTRQFWTFCAMLFCLGFCLYIVMVHVVPYATDLGIPATTAAGILSAMGLLSIVGRVGMGHIADRFGSRLVFTVSFISMAAALLWLLAATEMWMLVLFAAAFGLSYGGCITSQSTLVAELFGLRSHGTLLGIGSFYVMVGGAISPSLAGYIFDVTTSYQLAFLISATFAAAGFVLATLLKPT